MENPKLLDVALDICLMIIGCAIIGDVVATAHNGALVGVGLAFIRLSFRKWY